MFILDGLVKAGHDISDGGLITCLLEMAFAGNCGINVDLATEVNGEWSQNLNVILKCQIS